MAVQRLRFKDFSGGLSDDNKTGPANSASSLTSIDFRRSPAQAGLLRALTKESGSTVASEIHDAARIANGTVYMAGYDRLYKRAPGSNGAAGTYTALTSGTLTGLSNCRDLFYSESINSLFCIDSSDIHEYTLINSGGPVWSGTKYTRYTMFTQTNSGGTYALPTAIVEAERFSFTVSAEPVDRIEVNLAVRAGSTLINYVIHDAANTVVASGSELTTAVGTLAFRPGQVRLKLGNTYHVHFTNAVAGNTFTSAAANTLATISATVYAQRLVIALSTDYGHYAYPSGNKTYIGNMQYLAEWEILDTSANSTSGYNPHRLQFPSNFIVCGITEYSEYLVISCAVRENSDSLDSRGTSGYLFFWDKTSTFYNFSVPVPQGVPESVSSFSNGLHFIANGTHYRWAGGDIETVFQYPDADEFEGAGANYPKIDTYLQAPRHGMTAWKNLLLTAFPRLTANPLIEYGVYSYGHAKTQQPIAIGRDYLASHGHNTVQFTNTGTPRTPITGFTFIKSFGTNLLVGWTDFNGTTVTYGVDLLNELSGFAAAGVWRSLWFDNGDPDILKSPIGVKITFEKLQTGCIVKPVVYYDRDDATPITGIESDGTTIIQGVVGDSDVYLPLDTEKRFYEIMVGYDVTGSTTDDVRVNSVTLVFDDNRQNTNASRETRDTTA